jgi:hypothetical protein
MVLVIFLRVRDICSLRFGCVTCTVLLPFPVVDRDASAERVLRLFGSGLVGSRRGLGRGIPAFGSIHIFSAGGATTSGVTGF